MDHKRIDFQPAEPMTLLLAAQIIFGIILFVAVFNSAWVFYLATVLTRRRALPDDQPLGKAAILLSLRGADPKLASCLDRLLTQDYPDYDVLVVVDSKSDPAWPIVQATIERHNCDRLRVWPLTNRRRTCGLKNSSLVQLLDEIDESHQVIALADADLESHPTWLRELVAPLSEPHVGVTFGNRWFLPDRLNTGSLVRQVWNGPGLIVMSFFKIPWAGSMAIRKSLVDSGDIRERLATSIVDDGPVRVIAKQQGLKTVFVPSLIMANREACDLRFAYSFIRRQLTWTRTYFSRLWIPLVAYHLFATSASAVAQVVAVFGLIKGDHLSAALGVIGFFISLTTSVLHHLTIDWCARRAVAAQGERAPRVTVGEFLRLPFNLSLAALIGLLASFVATFARRIVWRGVTYEIRGPWNIRLLGENNANWQSAPAPTDSLADGAMEHAANESL